MKLGVISFGLVLGAALAGSLLELAIASALVAFLLVFAFERWAGGLVRDDLLRSVRNPFIVQDAKSIPRTITVVPVVIFFAGIAMAVLATLKSLDGYNYFVAALGGAMIAHAICARNAFAALAKEGALP